MQLDLYHLTDSIVETLTARLGSTSDAELVSLLEEIEHKGYARGETAQAEVTQRLRQALGLALVLAAERELDRRAQVFPTGCNSLPTV